MQLLCCGMSLFLSLFSLPVRFIVHNQLIRGVRYQCANCVSKPTPFSLVSTYSSLANSITDVALYQCSTCEERSYTIHDPMHVFFRLPRPVDRPIESSYPILPLLYRTPAGPYGGVYNSQDPKGNLIIGPSYTICSSSSSGYLASLVHGAAVCDRCMQRINGEWFRCVYCAKDLCDVCQSMDTHDNTHFFMVFKSEVDMNKFRYVTLYLFRFAVIDVLSFLANSLI